MEVKFKVANPEIDSIKIEEKSIMKIDWSIKIQIKSIKAKSKFYKSRNENSEPNILQNNSTGSKKVFK